MKVWISLLCALVVVLAIYFHETKGQEALGGRRHWGGGGGGGWWPDGGHHGGGGQWGCYCSRRRCPFGTRFSGYCRPRYNPYLRRRGRWQRRREELCCPLYSPYGGSRAGGGF